MAIASCICISLQNNLISIFKHVQPTPTFSLFVQTSRIVYCTCLQNYAFSRSFSLVFHFKPILDMNQPANRINLHQRGFQKKKKKKRPNQIYSFTKMKLHFTPDLRSITTAGHVSSRNGPTTVVRTPNDGRSDRNEDASAKKNQLHLQQVIALRLFVVCCFYRREVVEKSQRARRSVADWPPFVRRSAAVSCNLLLLCTMYELYHFTWMNMFKPNTRMKLELMKSLCKLHPTTLSCITNRANWELKIVMYIIITET